MFAISEVIAWSAEDSRGQRRKQCQLDEEKLTLNAVLGLFKLYIWM